MIIVPDCKFSIADLGYLLNICLHLQPNLSIPPHLIQPTLFFVFSFLTISPSNTAIHSFHRNIKSETFDFEEILVVNTVDPYPSYF